MIFNGVYLTLQLRNLLKKLFLFCSVCSSYEHHVSFSFYSRFPSPKEHSEPVKQSILDIGLSFKYIFFTIHLALQVLKVLMLVKTLKHKGETKISFFFTEYLFCCGVFKSLVTFVKFCCQFLKAIILKTFNEIVL